VPDLTSPRDQRGNYTRYHEPPRIGAMVLLTPSARSASRDQPQPGSTSRSGQRQENVLHLTAADEHRRPFPLSSVVDRSRPDDGRIAEVALPRAPDVGGAT
jgi:hypothetical protein